MPVLFFTLATLAHASAGAAVHFSHNRKYAFPVSGNVSIMSWTHIHWDGGNAVDIGIAPELASSSPLRAAFSQYHVVAVISGTAFPADNQLGGTALILRGDDGRQYYYAHLHDTWITTAVRVYAGETLGTVGRTGRWAQYLEPHLHFSIASRWHNGMYWKNDVNAAEWIKEEFGFGYRQLSFSPYPADTPHIAPLGRGYSIIRSFKSSQSVNRDLASIELSPASEKTGGSENVVAPMTGEVRVFKDTVLGLRIQITNRHTEQTILLSGLAAVTESTGSVARAGQVVGKAGGPINYMYFDSGVLTDPATVLPRQ